MSYCRKLCQSFPAVGEDSSTHKRQPSHVCIGKINTQIRLVSVPCDNATAVPLGRFGGDQSPRAGWVIFLCNAEKLTQPHLPSPERAGRPIWSNYSLLQRKGCSLRLPHRPGARTSGLGPPGGYGSEQRSAAQRMRNPQTAATVRRLAEPGRAEGGRAGQRKG